MKNVLIVYCHPYSKSFNHAVLNSVKENLDSKSIHYDVIDLYEEKFEPYYDKEELRLFHEGRTHDQLVTKYLNLLRTSNGVIFVTPIWWNSVPGMLKGFIDKVMKEGPGLSHTVSKFGIHGELSNLKSSYVLTTSTSPTLYFKLFMGNGIKRIFINKTLKQLGVKKGKWINFGGITGSDNNRRENYISKIRNYDFKFI